MTFKELFGAACLGAAYRTFYGVLSVDKVMETEYRRDKVLTKEYKDISIVQGAFRGMLTSLFLKGAIFGLEDKFNNFVDKYDKSFLKYFLERENKEVNKGQQLEGQTIVAEDRLQDQEPIDGSFNRDKSVDEIKRKVIDDLLN